MSIIAPSWFNTASATTASIGSSATATWALGTDNSLSTWDSNGFSWDTQAPPPTTFVQLSVASDGTLLGVDTSGDVYINTPGSGLWNLQIASGIASAAVTDSNNYVVIDTLGAITRWSGGLSTTIPSGPTQIATGTTSSVMFGSDASGNVYQWSETAFAWTLLSGALVQVSVSPAGQLYGTSSSGEGWTWDGTTWTYISYPTVPTATPISYLGFDGTSYWAIDTAGGVWTGV